MNLGNFQNYDFAKADLNIILKVKNCQSAILGFPKFPDHLGLIDPLKTLSVVGLPTMD